MRLSRLYIDQSLAVGSTVMLNQDSSHYLRHVLRLKTDAAVTLFNGRDDYEYDCLLECKGKQTIANTIAHRPVASESQLNSQIILGLGRSDHVDVSIQKCTELGVSRITLFNAQHSQIPLKPQQAEKRLGHWRAIAIKACEQCGRHRPPVIEFFHHFDTLLKQTGGQKNKLLMAFSGSTLVELLSRHNNQQQVSLLIGPEGGLSADEINRAKQQGFVSATLGPRVLRTETAAMATLTIVQSIWGDFCDPA